MRLVLAREVYQAADVLLVLVPLDPLGGSEHLASLAGRAVAVVSAGETSATRINAVGELIRLAGVTQLPAVLLGADRNDETVGATLLAVQRPPAGGPGALRTGSPRLRPAGAGEPRGGGHGPMSVTTTTVRPRKPPAPAEVAAARERATRRRVGIIWALLILNVLTFYPKTWSGQPLLIPIPSAVGKLMTQGSLPLALLLALTVNRRLTIRPNVYMCLVSLIAVEAIVTSMEAGHIGTIYRTFRLLMFVITLWLLTPFWGRRDLLLVRCHLVATFFVLSTVLLGLVVAPSTAISQGRWPARCGPLRLRRWPSSPR